MNKARIRVHWAWVPTAVFVAILAWTEYGALFAVSTMLAGLLLGLYVEHRARKRRERSKDQ